MDGRCDTAATDVARILWMLAAQRLAISRSGLVSARARSSACIFAESWLLRWSCSASVASAGLMGRAKSQPSASTPTTQADSPRAIAVGPTSTHPIRGGDVLTLTQLIRR